MLTSALLSSESRFSRLAKVVNISKPIVDLLNDSSASITFFAVPDSALRRPHRRSKDLAFSEYTLPEVVTSLEDLETFDEDSDKRRKRKKMLKKILEGILAYHILPSTDDITKNATHATKLNIPGALDDEPQRITVSNLLMTVNLRSRILMGPEPASNGVIYVLNHPLLPPPPVFTELFMGMNHFSILTSSLQSGGLKDGLSVNWSKEKKQVEGATAISFIAPTNIAFQKLPTKLQMLLFSPFGARWLKKLLQYHTVPHLVMHSDYLYNATSKKANSYQFTAPSEIDLAEPVPSLDEMFSDDDLNNRLRPHGGHHKVLPPTMISTMNLTLPTLLTNQTLDVRISKYNVSLPFPRRRTVVMTRIAVNGKPLAMTDVVAMNGAVHLTHSLLNPRPPGAPKAPRDVSTWEDWEDWFPQWASED
ncbi:hypothetical protein C8J56DRAFT_219532 [Mycena floridula]|nr:hypothetical protein C8J56DRAFT_219532 [Mycena floridula]